MADGNIIKDVPVQTTTIVFTEHHIDASTRRGYYTWNAGGVHVIVNQGDSLNTILHEIRRALRTTPHWDVATRIVVEFKECDYRDCLCMMFRLKD